VPLTVITTPGPVSAQGTNRIDRVAHWFLQKIAHDLGAIYLYHNVGGVTGCARYATSLQWSRESVTQALAGGFPSLPDLNGTNADTQRELGKRSDTRCDVPEPTPMLPAPGELPGTGAVVEHVYAQAGVYGARVTVSAGGKSASAQVTITVIDGPPPDNPPPDNPPPDNPPPDNPPPDNPPP